MVRLAKGVRITTWRFHGSLFDTSNSKRSSNKLTLYRYGGFHVRSSNKLTKNPIKSYGRKQWKNSGTTHRVCLSSMGTPGEKRARVENGEFLLLSIPGLHYVEASTAMHTGRTLERPTKNKINMATSWTSKEMFAEVRHETWHTRTHARTHNLNHMTYICIYIYIHICIYIYF